MSSPLQFRAAIFANLPHALLPECLEPGRRYRFSTNGKPTDKSGWCLLFSDERGGIFGCWRAGFTQNWTACNERPLTDAERAWRARELAEARRQREAEQRELWAANGERLMNLWSKARPVTAGDPVAQYLCARLRIGWTELVSMIDAAVIRFHPALPYRHDDGAVTWHPGMVAALRSPSGELVTVHRTYLNESGRKADVHQVKKLAPTAGSLAGACVRLGTPNDDGRIGVAEGIETALAASLASGLPVVAAYSATGLASWAWPPVTRMVIVFADNDEAGQRAADDLRQRVLRAGLKVHLLVPTAKGTDWCDTWAQSGTKEVTA